MYSYGNARHAADRSASRGRRGKRLLTLSVSFLLASCLCIVGVFAYIFTRTDEKKNTFIPGYVACEVTETFEENVKRNVAVKNTGNTESYIRAFVNVTWVKTDDTAEKTSYAVNAVLPVPERDYKIIFSGNTGWLKGSDGYWYYAIPVSPGDSTESLIDKCVQTESAEVPEGYRLSVEIVSSAIQSSPKNVVCNMWNVRLEGNRIAGVPESEVTGQ